MKALTTFLAKPKSDIGVARDGNARVRRFLSRMVYCTHHKSIPDRSSRNLFSYVSPIHQLYYNYCHNYHSKSALGSCLAFGTGGPFALRLPTPFGF